MRNRPDIPVQEMEAKIMIVEAPEAILARSHAAMRSNMQAAQERGLDGSKIVFGAIIAVRVDHSAPEQKSEGKRVLQRFWLAIVQRLLNDMTVDVKWMYAPSEFGKYTLWRGAAKEGNIGVSSIIAVIQKLTHTRHGRIKHHDRNKITAGLADPTFSLFSIRDDSTPDEDPNNYGLVSSSSSSSEEEEKK